MSRVKGAAAMPLISNVFSRSSKRILAPTTTSESIVARLYNSASANRRSALSPQTERQRREEARAAEAASMERMFTREWKAGDVYAPHDLSAAEARKWRKRRSPTTDAFDALNIDPLSMYKNFAVMSEYMTEMGRIRPQTSTGLRRVNQRKIAKAIRRAIALGLMPSVHRHPEIIRAQLDPMKNGGRLP